MTVNTTNITDGPYLGNDVADSFSYTFRIEDESQLKVYETDSAGVVSLLVLNTDYTVAGVGNDNGGTITRVAGALPSGSEWYIRSDYKSTQLTAFDSQGGFFPDVHESAMDKMTFLIQQLQDQSNRTVGFNEYVDIGGVSAKIDSPVAGQYLKVNDAADGFEYAIGTTLNAAAQTETQTLASGQTAVVFTASPAVAAFFINGSDADDSRLRSGTDYTVSGNTVTLAESYPAGTELMMVYYEADADIANLYANEIQYTQGGTGSVYRTVENRLRDTVSVKDFGAVGDGVTDDTAAIQAALDWATGGDGINGTTKTIYIPQGNYLISATLSVPSVTRVVGAGRWETVLTATAVFTGTAMLTDKGSASKLHVEHIRFNAIDAAATLTDVIKLGYTIPFGTEGRLYELLIRGGTNAASTNVATGVNIVGNVGYIQNVTVEYCDTAFLEGPNSTVNSYSVCTTIGQKTYGFSVGTAARLLNCHMEAPSATCIPYYIYRSASIYGCTTSLGNDNISSIVNLGSGGLGISVAGLGYLASNAGRATNILQDDRSISTDNPNWANDTSEGGQLYSFTDTNKYIRLGRAGYLGVDSNQSPRLEGKSAKGAVYAELAHDSFSARLADGGGIDAFYPNPDNAVKLGFAGRRWTQLFAGTATISTSDEREKTPLLDLDTTELAVAKELKSAIKKFKFKDAVETKGDSARIHVGVGAQTVKSIFESHGLVAEDYAILCYDEWEDEAGEQRSRYGVRYEELLAFIIAAL